MVTTTASGIGGRSGFASIERIFASGNPAAIELKNITSNIPVVFTINLDPVKYAFAANMNRPAGNMTGTVLYSSDLITKRRGH